MKNDYGVYIKWFIILQKFNGQQKKKNTLVETKRFFSRNAWSKEEMDVLYWYYEESKSYPDVIGQMVKRFRDSNFKTKYRIDVILQLLQQVCHCFSV